MKIRLLVVTLCLLIILPSIAYYVYDVYSQVPPLTLKWQIKLPIGYGHFHPSMGDVDSDGTQEIVLKYGDYVIVMNGKTGVLEWKSPMDGVGGAKMLELADLNADGTPEIVYCGDGLSVYARDGLGNLLWKSERVNGAGWSGTPIVASDTNGDGRSEVFVVTADTVSPYTGCVTKLNSSGSILAVSEICYQPCWGGLSLADSNFDGRFEIYLGDRASRGGPGGRNVSYPSNPARGLSCYDADTLATLWTRDDLYHSTPAPVLIDVTGDGKLEVIGENILNNGVCVVNAISGEDVYNWKGKPTNNHPKGTVWDIDLDGHVELISAWGDSRDSKSTKDFTVLDLVTGNIDYRASEINNWISFPPTVGDVDGDGYLDILVATSNCEESGDVGQGMFYAYDKNYEIIQTISDFPYGQQLWEPYCADCDSDGRNEVLIANSKGMVRCYDTPAPRPDPAPKCWSAWYSPLRQGAASISITTTVQPEIPEIPSALVLTSFMAIVSVLTLAFRRKRKPN
jgi:hypothetical protein